MSNLFEKIGSVVVSVGLAIGGFFGYVPEQSYVEVPVEEESLGADTVLPIAGMTFYLSGTGISSSATSFTLTSLTVTQNGKKITDSELSDIFYITLEPGSRTRQEIISCTTVVQNADGTATISGCTRGLSPVTPYTASTTLQFTHSGGSIVIFSNPPQLFNQAAFKDNDEIITGQWTFSTFPVTPSSSPATATTSGTVEFATGAEAASSTLTGDVGRLALGTDIATSSAPASGNVVVVTGDNGKIDSGFFDVDSSINRIVFDSNGTYTKSARTKYIFVEVWAGGGSGGSRADTEEAGGGGGGGYISGFIASSSLSATTSVFVGDGGVAVSGNSGNAGASSTFSTLVAWGGNYGCFGGTGAAGGAGGGASATSTVCSSATQGNAVDIFGGTGGGGGGSHGSSTYGGGGGGGALNSTTVGGGGSGVFGGGGGGGCAGGVAGIAGTSQFGGAGGVGCGGNGATPGGGGGGSNSGSLSGAGGKGRVIITEYF